MFSLNIENHPDMIVNRLDDCTQTLYEDECGILLFNQTTGIAMADATNKESATRIISIIEKHVEDVVIRGEYLYNQLPISSFRQYGKAYHFVTFQEEPRVQCDLIISHKELDESFINVVCKHYSYKDLATPTYISQVLKEGVIGAFYRDELAGFVGTHDTGSIGLLEVLPTYQHHGIAQSLLAKMISDRKEKGILPYGEVLEDNHISKSLLAKMGYTCNQKLAYWFSKQ